MKFEVRLAESAEADLRDIYDYVALEASPDRASAYVDRIMAFLSKLELFPQRGTLHDDIRNGLRTIGFERRISIAFVVESGTVVILRLLYAGRKLDPDG